MAKSLDIVYADAIRDGLRLYAAWPIGIQLDLGDYGVMRDGNVFVRYGNLSDHDVNGLAPVITDTKLSFEFKTSGIEEISTEIAAGGDEVGKIGIRINFALENSVYFRSKRLTHYSIPSFKELSVKVMTLFGAGVWDGRWCVIHSMFKSKGTTVLISTSNGASIEISGSGTTGTKLDIAEASAKLGVRSEKNLGLKAIALSEGTPLFGIARIRPKNFWASMLSFGKEARELKPYVTGSDIGEEVFLPGELIAKHSPEISPHLAADLGQPVDELFHLVEDYP